VVRSSAIAGLEPGFPVQTLETAGSFHGGAATHTLVGNMDAEPTLEVVVTALASGPLYAWHADGSLVPGWPAQGGAGAAYPAMGNLSTTNPGLEVFAGYMGLPSKLVAFGETGTPLPGWPVLWGGTESNSSAPVVGDVDGDTWPDILVTTHLVDSETGEVRVYDRSGILLSGFPFQLLLGGGAVPAIADIDLDGRNEILVTSSYWPGYPGYYDKIWAYDLGGPTHGRIEWGQFGGGPQHQGSYPPGVIPAVDLNARNDGPTPLGHTTTLTATTRLGCGVAYTWNLGDGTLGSGAVLTHTYAALGTYTAIVTASNSASTLTATTVVTVVAEPINGLHAVSDSPTVLGQATALTATVVSGSRVTYTWDLGDGATGSGALVTHTYPALGPYTAVVTASNSVSLLTATTTVMIVDEPITSLSAASDSPTALGTPTTLSATVVAGGHVVYDWDLGDGAGGSGALLTHTYAAVGAYTAVVTASNVGSTGTATTTVRVEQAVSGLRAVNDSPTALGRPTALAAAVAAGTDVHYRWDLGDGTVLFLPFLAHIYPALGTYTAVVTASNSVSLLTATTAVLIVPDVPIRGLAAANDSPTVLGRPTTLSATVAAGTNVTYTWALGDGTMGAGAVLTHTYAAAGVYTAVVTASNSVGLLRATTPVTVVRPLFSIYLPLAWRGRP
jgi:PKD repeat protein